MFSSMIHTVAKLGASKLRNAAVGAALLGLPTAAFAHHRFFHPGIFIPAPEVVVDPVIPVPAPVVVTPARDWVQPVYQTVTDRVWVPALTQTQVQQVRVPAEYGYRDVVVYGIFGRHIHREQVLIRPAHIESRPVEVVVAPGHFELQTHQVLVTDGHWQDVQ